MSQKPAIFIARKVFPEVVAHLGQHFEVEMNESDDVLPPAELYLAPEQLRERLNRERRIDLVPRAHNEHVQNLGLQPAPLLPINRKGDAPAEELQRFLAAYPGRVLIAAETASSHSALRVLPR